MKRTAHLLLFTMLVGCAPSTVQGLRDQPAGKLTFEVDENYQSVYRRIITPARNCWRSVWIGSHTEVQGDIYTDTRSGNVALVDVNALAGMSTYLTIDVIALSENKTRITTYYAHDGWKNVTKTIESWVKQNSTECQAPT